MIDEPFIPLCVPCLSGREWEYVKECLDTNWVSYLGSFVSRFEKDLARAAGSAHAVAMNSGTSAIHIALRMLGVERGTEVVMPALTFVAPANAVAYCGASPTFVDVSGDDWQVDVDKLQDFLSNGCERRCDGLFNRETGRRIAALMPVHLLGGMGDVDAIAALANRFGLPVVEDAAEALGATYGGRGIGAPSREEVHAGRLVATSFNGNKIITTGGGGALLMQDEEQAARARHLSTTAKSDPIEFDHDEVGYNYRLTNIAAAIGVAQLEVLGDYVEKKRTIAKRYADSFANVKGVITHPERAGTSSTFWMYSLLVPGDGRPLVDRLNEGGIGSRPLWRLMNELPAFKDTSFSHDLTGAVELQRRGLSLPCSVGITTGEQERVIAAVLELLS